MNPEYPVYIISKGRWESRLTSKALEKLDISPKNAKPKSILHTISQAKNQLIDPVTYNFIARGYFQKIAASVYSTYQELMR